MNNEVSIIWGPPGTGKTNSISKAIESHIKEGRKILLVSHANTAVDEALYNVAKQLNHTQIYQSGKLIRLGVTSEKLSNEFPLVVLDNISENLGANLVKEKITLKKEIDKLDLNLSKLNKVLESNNKIKNLNFELNTLNESLSTLEEQIKLDKASLQYHKNKLVEVNENIEKVKSYSSIRKLFSTLDHDKLVTEKDQISIKMNSLNKGIKTTEEKLKINKEKINEITKKLNREKNYFNNLIKLFDFGFEKIINKSNEFKEIIAKKQKRITEIQKELDNIQSKAISNAKLVATTLTKTYLSKELENKSFDVLIIDEASMAPLPYLYWATSMVNSHVTIVGDFNQLPPICQSKEDIAKKWLGRNIYDIFNINTVDKARKSSYVSLLDTQYRMNFEIADISNQLFYDGILKNSSNTVDFYFTEELTKENPLAFVDTSEINPWSSHLSSSSRFNIYSALVSASIVKHLIKSNINDIGIITPYKPQARLINKILEDWNLSRGTRVNTVHSFQGGEKRVIIFDVVESPGTSKWSLLDDTRSDSDAKLLLNVALSRAKEKVFLVGFKDYLNKIFNENSALAQILKRFETKGIKINSNQFLDNYVVKDFDNYSTQIIEGQITKNNLKNSTLFNENEFWPNFINDLLKAKETIMIMSPFISKNRTGKLIEFFRTLINNNIKIKVITRPPNNQPKSIRDHAEEVINQFIKIGVSVQQRSKIHQKIAIIDSKITWEGSLNILSHNNTKEQMRRIEGKKTADEIIENLGINKNNVKGTVSDKSCPQCKTGKLIIRKSKFGKFYGCDRYPKCKYTQNIKRAK
ncbi:MAG: AAA domain-containing protein [Bacillota bacterium]